MQTLKTPLFLVCSAFFLLHQLLQYGFRVQIPLADAYLDNLVAMPIILTLLLAERRYLFKKGESYRLSLVECLLAALYVAAVSEWLFPMLSERFTYDPLDFLLFFVGAGLYYWQQQAGKIPST